MNTELWSKVKDVLQVLIIPTILWSLWVSRSVEIITVKMSQQEEQLQEARQQLRDVDKRSRDTENRLIKIETKLESVEDKLVRMEMLLDKLVTAQQNAPQQCGTSVPYGYSPHN